jgi:nucleoside-diphosphate-sugar epimerase
MTGGPVLVTGAGGFIGRRLVQTLQSGGCDVIGWTRAEADLRAADEVQDAMAAAAPRIVFHLAACSATGSASAGHAITAEVAMVSNLAAALPTGARMIVAGSMAEFGYAGVHSEDAPRRPVTAYGRAKAAAVDRAVALHDAGAAVMVARLFGVYGPGEAPTRLLPHLIAALRAGQDVPLSDGQQVRDFIHVDDVCRVLMALGDADAIPQPVINVGTGQGLAVADVCRAVATALGVDAAHLHFGAMPRRAVDEDVLVADVTRLAAVTDVPPQRWLASTDEVAAMVRAFNSCVD